MTETSDPPAAAADTAAPAPAAAPVAPAAAVDAPEATAAAPPTTSADAAEAPAAVDPAKTTTTMTTDAAAATTTTTDGTTSGGATASTEDANTAGEEASSISSKEDAKKKKGGSTFRIFRSRSKSTDAATPTSSPTPAAAESVDSTDAVSANPEADTNKENAADDAAAAAAAATTDAPAGESSTTEEASPVRKAKSFKRIRGLLSGESGKERRERRAQEKAAKKAIADEKKAKKAEEAAAKKAAKAAAAADKKGGADAEAAPSAEDEDEAPQPSSEPNLSTVPSGDDDDGSTVFDVDVDERSQATPSVASTTGTHNLKGLAEGDDAFSSDVKKPYMLKVVLLLMDPETRRFELLQLEFDSLKALVADVLKQIPLSVTEEALRKQEYMGICGKDGKLMDPDKLLSDFCAGNNVLVAIPKDMPPKECARLARPILSDDKVVSMLLASGIDAKAWSDNKKPKRKVRGAEDDEAAKSKKKGVSRAGVWMVATIILAILVQVGHIYLSAAIKPGHAVQPGVFLRKCGILSFLPPNRFCEDDARMVFAKDGHVTVYGKNNEVVWELEGAVCSATAKDPCTPELRFHDDMTLSVAGKHIPTVKTFHKDSSLHPWPFAEKPKIRVIVKK